MPSSIDFHVLIPIERNRCEIQLQNCPCTFNPNSLFNPLYLFGRVHFSKCVLVYCYELSELLFEWIILLPIKLDFTKLK